MKIVNYKFFNNNLDVKLDMFNNHSILKIISNENNNKLLINGKLDFIVNSEGQKIELNYDEGNNTYTIPEGKHTAYICGDFSLGNESLGSTVDIEGVDLYEGITTVEYMFSNCENINELNVNFNGCDNIIKSNYMFNNCRSLKKVTFKNWNTNKLESMEGMFKNCISLLNLDLNKLNVSKVTNMNSLFDNCNSMTELKINTWDISKVLNFRYCFQNCSSLLKLELDSKFDNKVVQDCGYMFNNCSSLTEINVINFYAKTNAAATVTAFDGCDNITRVGISITPNNALTIPYNCTEIIDMYYDSPNEGIIPFYRHPKIKKITGGTIVRTGTYDFSYMEELEEFTGVTIKNTVKTMYRMFCSSRKLKIVDTSKWDLSGVTDMFQTFYLCNSLEYLDISKLDFSNVKKISYIFNNSGATKEMIEQEFNFPNAEEVSGLFGNCRNLNGEITLKIKTPKAKKIDGLFTGCSKIEKLDLSQCEIPLVENTSNMFTNCASVKETNLSCLTGQNLINANFMFVGNGELEKLDLSNLDSSKVEKSVDMFSNGFEITSDGNVIELNNFCRPTKLGWLYNDTNKILPPDSVKEIFNLNYYCNTTTPLKGNTIIEKITGGTLHSVATNDFSGMTALTNFNNVTLSSNITSLSGLFDGCTSLVKIDISNWDVTNITEVSLLFNSVPNTCIIKVGSTFNFTESDCGWTGTFTR